MARNKGAEKLILARVILSKNLNELNLMAKLAKKLKTWKSLPIPRTKKSRKTDFFADIFAKHSS